MLDSQNRLQNYFKNTKTTKFLLELALYTSEGHTCKVLSFYDFWFTFNDKFCNPYPIVDFYAYLITKIGNGNLKVRRVTTKHEHTHTAFVEGLNKVVAENFFKVLDAQGLNDPEKVSTTWVKHLYGLADRLKGKVHPKNMLISDVRSDKNRNERR